jgi:hypothetical protein
MAIATLPSQPQKSNYEHRITAGTFIYSIGAGITAAAGTRLALQLFLAKCLQIKPIVIPG